MTVLTKWAKFIFCHFRSDYTVILYADYWWLFLLYASHQELTCHMVWHICGENPSCCDWKTNNVPLLFHYLLVLNSHISNIWNKWILGENANASIYDQMLCTLAHAYPNRHVHRSLFSRCIVGPFYTHPVSLHIPFLCATVSVSALMIFTNLYLSAYLPDHCTPSDITLRVWRKVNAYIDNQC